MIFEHEIPSGSKLYFGKSAKIKREIEAKASTLLEELGFEEIVTPIFSYHQHDAFDDMSELIRLNDASNHTVTLRADSTPDVFRIATKRLARSQENKKWFYIQPTLAYPTKEHYQIGGEIIEGSFEDILDVAIKIFDEIDIKPLLQIANIKIPALLHTNYGVPAEALKLLQLEKILDSKHTWMPALAAIQTMNDFEDLSIYPQDIADELGLMREKAQKISYPNIIFSPLYYAKMRYYKSLIFRMFSANSLLAMGGEYIIEDTKAAGFAVYNDECISIKLRSFEEIH
ncbi:MAG: ATP phosphoribosyltransferase regulatory subunit [Campylobacterales bacterium]|nr:ATP phosphoribosyltransferase regulatory subunit [Campylobacterales bacterium]